MSTKDEKDWLRAILEGRVKPGDAEWERIWQDENFTGVRRVLRIVFQKVCKFQFIYFCNRTVKNNLLWNLHLSK